MQPWKINQIARALLLERPVFELDKSSLDLISFLIGLPKPTEMAPNSRGFQAGERAPPSLFEQQ